MEKASRKLYYSIGEVSEELGESVSLVRFWSDSFPELIRPERNRKGNRMFTPEDVKVFRMLHHLVKEKKMTLEGAKEYMLGHRDALESDMDILERLESIKNKLNSVLETL